MYMAIAAILFSAYFLNVSLGAFGAGIFLGDVQEMILLAVSVFFFVVAILRTEKAEKETAKQETNNS
ncbi:MAG: hypothetical protein GY947_14695 [Rhodobacteraceae bacterium]|nr:hypothetical protein [Paracoccaceae bacterium]